MENLALKAEAVSLLETLSEDKIRFVVQFAQFISGRDVSGQSARPPAPKRLPLGFLRGTAKVSFSDDWEMTTEELLAL